MDSLNDIKETVERITGFEFVKDTSRVAGVTDARRIYCHLARGLTGFTFKEIGEFINKEHSVIVHHVNKTEDLLEFDKKFERLYTMCLKSLPKISDEKQFLDKYKYHLNQVRLYRRKLKKNT